MIVNILPYKESFDAEQCGAIALTVSDIIQVSRFGLQTHILGGKKTDNPLTTNFHCIKFRRRLLESKSKAYLRHCVEFIANNKVKLIELHNRPAWVPYLVRKTKVRICLFLHNDPLEMQNAKTVKERLKLLQDCEIIYCVSKFVRKRFLEGIEDMPLRKKVRVIYNITYPLKAVDLSRKQKLIIYVGKISKEKGVAELANSLVEVLPEFPDWKALIIGAPTESSLFDWSNSAVRKAVETLPKQIIHYSKKPYHETLNWMKEAAISVVPSKQDEPFGRTVLESLANGCAIVTTKKGGIPEIVANSGALLGEVKPEFIAHSLRDYMKYPERLFKYQQKSVNRAIEFIDNYSSIKKLDAIRSRIMNQDKIQLS